MNISVNVDCSPEEARRFMGLPDLGGVHEVYLARLRTMMEEGMTPDMIEALMRSWGPMGEAGLGMWRQMFETMSAPGLGNPGKK